jgi:hypothetical protein
MMTTLKNIYIYAIILAFITIIILTLISIFTNITSEIRQTFFYLKYLTAFLLLFLILRIKRVDVIDNNLKKAGLLWMIVVALIFSFFIFISLNKIIIIKDIIYWKFPISILFFILILSILCSQKISGDSRENLNAKLIIIINFITISIGLCYYFFYIFFPIEHIVLLISWLWFFLSPGLLITTIYFSYFPKLFSLLFLFTLSLTLGLVIPAIIFLFLGALNISLDKNIIHLTLNIFNFFLIFYLMLYIIPKKYFTSSV